VLAAITDAGAEPWVHSCAPDTPWGLVRGAGAAGLAVDVDVLDASGHDTLAEALEAGETVALGAVPSLEPATSPTDKQVVERVLRWLDMVGLDPEEVGERLVVTPACGLAGAGWGWARRAMALARSAGSALGGR
jgi:methionine synthase II (cobalamin-independent)